MAAPRTGANHHTQSCWSAQVSENNAVAVARAGLSAPFVNGMVHTTNAVSPSPIAKGATPLGARTEVALSTIKTRSPVANSSARMAMPRPKLSPWLAARGA